MPYFVYLLACRDGTYYCGYTTDLTRRLAAHNAGTGAKYTRGRRPVKLVYSKRFATRREAMRREHAIKALGRRQKQALLAAQK